MRSRSSVQRITDLPQGERTRADTGHMPTLRLLCAVLLAAFALAPSSASAITPSPETGAPSADFEPADDPGAEDDAEILEDDADEAPYNGACEADDDTCSEPSAGIVDHVDPEQDRRDALSDGAIPCGTVELFDAGTVTRELRLAPVKRKVKSKSKSKARAAATKRTVKGKLVARTSRRAGTGGDVLELRCKLTAAGKRELRRRGAATLVVHTTVRRAGAAPVVYTGKLRVA